VLIRLLSKTSSTCVEVAASQANSCGSRLRRMPKARGSKRASRRVVARYLIRRMNY